VKDVIGRNINYLRVSVTDLCNLRCIYCMPEEGICKKEHRDILTLEEIFEVIKSSVDLGINKVRITGGEPLARKGVVELIDQISHLEKVKDIAITTNGILLKQYAEALKTAGLKRVNISLDTMDEEKYKQITRGGRLKDVLEGIEEAKKMNFFPIKLNVVVINGFNDEEAVDFAKLTLSENIDVRFIELMPIGQASKWAKRKFISNEVIKERIQGLMPIDHEDKSSPAKYYKLPGAQGKIGFINPISSHFCKECNRIRLTADGKIKPCLHSDQEIDVKSVLRENKEKLTEVIKNAIMAKPEHHTLNEKNNQAIKRDMVRIGG
jgi:cyclic pyranopterin phosphate synthase